MRREKYILKQRGDIYIKTKRGYIYILNQRGDIYIYIYTHVYMVNTRKNATICEFEWKL